MQLECRRVSRRAGDHDLNLARVIRLAVPIRTGLDDAVVNLGANPAAHADDHGLAVDRLRPRVEMGEDIRANRQMKHGLC